MASEPYDLALRAAWYADPRSWEFRRDVAICIRAGAIADVFDERVARTVEAKRKEEYDGAVVLPAFVNAHVHLDLSHLHGEDLDGSNFDDWLMSVIRGRKAPPEQVATAAGDAARDMVASGTACVIDILAQHGATLDVAKAVAATPIGGVLASEVFNTGLGNDAEFTRTREAAEATRNIVASRTTGRPLVAGLSPHTPYTTSADLYRRCAEYARKHKMLQTTHLAESPAEREFLMYGTGRFRRFSERLGADFSAFKPYRGSPLDFWLEAMDELKDRTLFVHCYDLLDDEIRTLGDMNADIAYCPRSRTYFGHPPFKLAAIVNAGCNVSLGTDSRASNWNLNLFEELRHMRKEQPNADAKLLWGIATLNGRKVLARALPGVPADIRTWADLNIVQWDGDEPSLDSLIEACPPTVATIIGGEVAYRRTP